MNQYTQEYKNYYIKPHKDYPAHYVVVTVGKGGKIPDVLSGIFTKRSLAMEEIDKYLSTKPSKEVKND